tara:strand:- start:1449 stop:1913 length:465 start_codon:yes stop_codon:yes gene_type:complete
MKNNEILDGELRGGLHRRRDLLPRWIKSFLWLFLILGSFVPLGLIAGMFDMPVKLSIYGIETNSALSLSGLLITALFSIKSVVAFGMWTEKDWAIKLAIFDGVVGFVICSVMMFVLPSLNEIEGSNFKFRLELIPLIFYLIKMIKIKSEWEVEK